MLNLTVNGNVSASSTITARLIGLLDVGDMAGQITQNATLSGTVHVRGTMDGQYVISSGGLAAGSAITVGGDLRGRIQTNSNFSVFGPIQIGGDVDGPADAPSIQVGTLNSASGSLTVDGSLANHNASGPEIVVDSILQDASVMVGGLLNGQIHVTSDVDDGTIAIGGDVDGPTDAPAIQVDGSLLNAARITVNGSLLDHNASGAEIVVNETMAASAAIAIDYDGWHDGDDWESGATIDIDPDGTVDPYTGNTPAAHIWEIRMCIGNCNNDDPDMGPPDSFDIAAFVAALTGEATYAAAYPGLEGSRIYHADCNCNGEVDAFDIAAFVALLSGQVCQTVCPEDNGGLLGGEPGLSTKDVAALFTKNLTDDQLAAFMESLAELVAGLGDSAEAEYWAQVLKRLEG